MKSEHWKSVRGYEEQYDVSSWGRIRNKKARKHILKPWARNGYPSVELWKDGKGIPFFIHRIVAESFLGKKDQPFQVNHKNHIRTDNNVENLEWVSASENIMKMWIFNLELLGYKITRPDPSKDLVS